MGEKQDHHIPKEEGHIFVLNKRLLVFRWSDLFLILGYCALAAVALWLSLSRMLPQAEKLRLAFHNTSIAASPSELLLVEAPVILTPNAYCRDIAKNVLGMGGNAVDAAIALSLCSVAASPQSWSLGGGIVILYYNRTSKQANVIDALTAAPKALSTERFHQMQLRGLRDAESVGVPGTPKGLELASKKFGKLPWVRVVEPVSDLCSEGFNVSDALARVLKAQEKSIERRPSLRDLFLVNETGKLLQEGDVFRRPVLAATLKRLAQYGAADFYSGLLSKNILTDIRSKGSILNTDDMGSYEAIAEGAIKVPAGVTSSLLTSPRPSGGPALAMAASLFKGLVPLMRTPDLGLQYHLLVEVFKQSLSHRMDTSLAYSDSQLQNITRTMSGEEVRPSVPGTDDAAFRDAGIPDSVAVLDPSGDAVVVFSDMHGLFGSQVYSNTTDVIFNAALREFAVTTAAGSLGTSNEVQYLPGTRAPTTMAPAIVVEDSGDVRQFLTVCGSGNQTLTAAMQILWRTLHTNLTVKEAIDAPRLHHPLVPDVLYAEKEFPGVILQKLHVMGYKLATLKLNTTVTGALRDVLSGKFWVNMDHRIVF
ncbi:scoloptoxin SSD14 [Ixodes scapularis]|uniref:scoloptoxin SSD14 n=1 Tax=Ixodes scapularis TaxID=6945 RepID=UPI001A9D5E2B|nr:scoloptoxin SSD14 [Ixodes scapularis]